MPDIRQLLSQLSPEDKQLWSQHRTEMRRSYMTAHNSVLGINAWTDFDDAFLDLIDTKLAQLFGSAGKLDAEELVKHDDADRIENDIHSVIKGMKKVDNKMEPNVAVEKSTATASMQNGWQDAGQIQAVAGVVDWPNAYGVGKS